MKICAKLLILIGLLFCFEAHAEAPKLGVVVMHGKGGTPTRMAAFAGSLESRGFLVMNLDMPWSGQRSYDVDVATADAEILSALAKLRAKGATKFFVSGHSLGGLFALHFAGKYKVDGVIAIAPGGGSAADNATIADSLKQAQKLIEDGKGAEKTSFFDYEGGRGAYPISTTPANYASWFDPNGTMIREVAVKAIKADTPVLYIAPTKDYRQLVSTNGHLFDLLAKHPLTQKYEPDSNHMKAPDASAGVVGDWILTVANQ